MKIAIIGGGLSGSFFALSLMQEAEIHWFDTGKKSASNVSAGIVNVITGQNFSLTWNATELLTQLKNTLKKYGFLSPFFIEKEIYRPFPNASLMNKTYEKTLLKEYASFVEIENVPRKGIVNSLGGIRIRNAGYVQVRPMLQAIRKFLIRQGVKYLPLRIDYSEIIPTQEGVKIGTEKYDFIVFCEGAGIFSNPFWKGKRTLSPLKGETLTVELTETDLDFILIKKAYIIPVGEKRYIVGSTYERGSLDFSPTEKGKQALLQKLFSVLPEQKYTILKHEAGVRVTTYNRRFFVGRSYDFSNILFFNGLGTKGLLSAPYGAKILKNHILHRTEIPKEISTTRFY